MGDAFTDIKRDEKIRELADEIVALEQGFELRPTKEKARIILKKLEHYRSLPQGFWYFPDQNLTLERIRHYRALLASNNQ